ncbi:MAG: sulfotransferase [Betaproteobacteria bacterium]|nr:sulfotransferase [Betaproteobacteria bacterium]
MAKSDVLTRSKKRRAQTLLDKGLFAEARELCQQLCRIDTVDAEAWLMLANIYLNLGLHADSESCAKRALTLEPRWAAAHHALGASLECQKKLTEAIGCYRRAVEWEPGFANGHFFLANALRACADLSGAARHYRKAVAIQPDFFEALCNLGALLTGLGDLTGAVEVLNRAACIHPDDPHLLVNQGLLLWADNREDEARAKLLRALTFAPDGLEALASLAELCERTNRLEEARAFVAKGLAVDPHSVSLTLTAAKLARQDGRTEEAIRLMESLLAQRLDDAAQAEVHLRLGQVYDRAGEHRRAFGHFEEGKRRSLLSRSGEGADKGILLEKIAAISRYAVPGQEGAIGRGGEKDAPIFLMGFQRSGTTLLDQILDSHPTLQTMEEKPAANAVEEAFLHKARPGDDRALVDLSERDVQELRDAYGRAVAQHLTRQAGRRLVDRNPGNTYLTPLLWRVFPKAKFILAVRHPCDVCLSCFMQHFAPNVTTAHFYTLEDTANLYARTMEAWIQYASSLPIDYHIVRYESLVDDLEDETRRLLRFLDAEWDDAVLRPAEHANSRRVIRTASYHQVTQPIYQHAKYRWRRYSEALEPIMTTLAPYIEYFGYSTSQA